MATPKITGKKTTGKVSAKRVPAKTTGKAKMPSPVSKSFAAKIGDDVKNINKQSGVGLMLGSTPQASKATNTDKILDGISQKLDVIIDLLKLEKGV